MEVVFSNRGMYLKIGPVAGGHLCDLAESTAEMMPWLWTLFSLPYLLDANVFRPNGDATAWLLWNHPTAIFDPPYCASSVTLMINDIVLMAQNVVAMTGDCMGDLISPPDCAADITSFIANTLDAAQQAAALSMACAGEITDCEQLTLDAAESFSSLASDLVGASTNCDIDAFLCTINLVDAMKQIFGAATDIDSATGSCPKETVLEHYLQLKYPDWAGWSWILPRLRKGNLTAGSTFFTSTTETPREASDDVEDKEEIVSSRYESFAGGGKIYKVSKGSASKIRPPSIGLVDETVAGPIIATDEPGMIRVGSAVALENTHGLFNQGGNARQTRRLEISDLEAVVLPTLHDANAEVFFFMNYPREESDPLFQEISRGDAEKTKIRRVELHFDSSRNTCEATGVLSWLMLLFQFWGRNCLTLRSSRSS